MGQAIDGPGGGLAGHAIHSSALVLVYPGYQDRVSLAPVFFRQNRTGKGGKRFQLFKFRTMVVNAEEMKLQLAHLNELQWPDFKITNDPRITRVGRILRKTSLDELPQILNIIRGDMSFVGPRPTSFAAETHKLWQTERLDVQPGLNGYCLYRESLPVGRHPDPCPHLHRSAEAAWSTLMNATS